MAKTATYSLISSQTLGSATTSLTFSSIPQTFTDLVLVISATSTAITNIFARPNGDASNLYSRTGIYGTGTSAASVRVSSNTSGLYLGDPDTSSRFGTGIVHFMDYSNTTTFKTSLTRHGIPSDSVSMTVSLWRSTAAISSLDIYLTTAMSAGSTFKLYGIEAYK